MIIRIANVDDGESIARIYAPIVTDTAISFEEIPPPLEHPWLVAEDDDSIAGFAYASPHRSRSAYRWSSDVSAYLAEGARRRGIGSMLYRQLLSTLV
ncbi:MAG: Phosphinothricin N-acetyltransferase [Hyphomonas sp. TMED17]|nr:MAG: Phosphinothricin N-acetyltransferase [Hyphomonas sp. TMED17]